MTPARDDGAQATLLYIGGLGRSGSTLLERMLGQVPGTVAVGEVVHLIARGLIDDEDCGCGRPFHECPFWTDVGAKAFGGWDRMGGREWLALQEQVDRTRFIPLMVAPVLPRYRRALNEHRQRLARLYEAIAEVSGAAVILDSSKQPSTAFLLRGVRGVRLRVVHLVRDSRGVAYSWTKAVTRPEIRGRRTLMPQFHPSVAAVRWLSNNGLIHLLRLLGTPVTFARYEDLLAAPAAEAERLLAAIDHPVHADDLTFITDHHVELSVDHSVAGNPMRFRYGLIALRHDGEWRTSLSRRHRRIVTLMTAPVLALYGYPIGRLRGIADRFVRERRPRS